VFNIGPALINPKTGEPIEFELPRTADQIEVWPDPYGNADQLIAPNIIIEKVELVYFASSPPYNEEAGEALPAENYIQPAWHFHGYNSNGDAIDFLIQALNPEYLLPDLAPHLLPG
jgi:hypothetical protein